jgi:hypothetical protein
VSENIIYLVIVIILLFLLIVFANHLVRRAKKKGNLLTGNIQFVELIEKRDVNASLFITLASVVFITWGFLKSSWISIIIGVFCLLISVGFRYLRTLQYIFRKEKPHPSAEALKPLLIAYAKKVVKAAAPTIKLDYSPQSIRDIENVLSGIHDAYLKSGDNTGLNGIALEFAAYIVEVIKRNYGPVKWDRDGSEFGLDSFPLLWRGRLLFPYAWCQKRIFDGPDDNVWIKFKLLVMDVK